MSLTSQQRVEARLRQSGFKILAGFSVAIAIVILLTSPRNVGIALAFPIVGITASSIALLMPKYDRYCAMLWLSVNTLVAPLLVFVNGLAPATLIPLALLFPIMLMKGAWRVIPLVSLACCTFIVPFSAQSYDAVIWARVSVTNCTVAIMIYSLMSLLEKAWTESINQAAALQNALDAERKAKEAQSNFLATMSHEIRTPMNGLIGLLDNILATKISESSRNKLELAYRSSQSLNVILNDILDLTKIAAGKMHFERIPVSLRDLISDIVSLFTPRASENGTVLQHHIDPQLATHHIADPTRLKQVLSNLVSNAIKFTANGTVTLSMSVIKSQPDRQTILFEVIDTGLGIDDAFINDIFEPYTQARLSDTREFGGTGLGLQIAQSLLNQVQSKIVVTSEKGHGSTFYFKLALPVAETPATVAASPSDTFTFCGKVLVVDDNEINRVVAREVLIGWGLNVVLAEDGMEALHLATQESFDLILMDLNMPVLDGIESTKEIRNHGITTPIVALTAAVLEADIEKCKSVGMQHHLTKPINKEALQRILSLYLT